MKGNPRKWKMMYYFHRLQMQSPYYFLNHYDYLIQTCYDVCVVSARNLSLLSKIRFTERWAAERYIGGYHWPIHPYVRTQYTVPLMRGNLSLLYYIHPGAKIWKKITTLDRFPSSHIHQ